MLETLDNLTKNIASSHIWLVQSLAIMLLTVATDFVVKRVLNRLLKKASKTKQRWDNALIAAAISPVRLSIWFVGIFCVLKILDYRIPNIPLFNMIPAFNTLVVVLILTWFGYRFTTRAEQFLVKKYGNRKTGFDKTLIHATAKLVRIILLVTSLLILLQSFGIGISGILAFGGIGGLAVSFAAKDMLSNFFGGLMLYLDRPFKIGEWIRSTDKNIEGVVENIGWRLTQIRTFDKRLLFVPNAVFSNICVENPSRMTNRRIRTVVGLRYDDANKLTTIMTAIENMLLSHPDIDTNMTLCVRFVAYGPSSLDFLIYTFTKTIDWVTFQTIQQDVLLQVLHIINEQEAEIAFPTTTTHIPNNVNFTSAEYLMHVNPREN